MEDEKILIGLQMEDEDEVFQVHLTPARIEEISTDDAKYCELYYSLKNAQQPKPIELQSNNEDKHNWSNSSIKLLIELRLAMEMEFVKPKEKKRKLWKKISLNMKNIGGYDISKDECDIKYRNLLATYRKNKEKKTKTGESKIVWEYFELFDEVLGHKASSCPPVNLLTSSILNDEAEANKNKKEKRKTENQTKTNLLPTPKKRKEMSLAEYLAHKKDMEEKRWDEKKRLKEKEIEAIKLLAAAIAGPSGINEKNTKKEKSKRKDFGSSSDSD